MAGSWEPGQLVWAGFPGLEVPRYLADAIGRGRIGGVTLFRRNIESPSQLRRLVRDLHAMAPREAPLLISMDQEGGRVARLRAPWTSWPPMREVGRFDDIDTTRAIGAAHARELRDVGTRLNFAPVADVDSNPANPVIGDRSFADDPQTVARHVCAYLEGLQGGGVASCVKHFPGHGDTDLDSHLALPKLRHSRARLDAIELPPFRAAIAAGVASIMTAHVIFEAIDPLRPATMSPDVLAILRDELAYEGLVITDDLEMKAVANHFDLEERILGPLRAGCDVLLVCSQQDLQEEAIARLEKAPDALLEGPLQRLRAFKLRWTAETGDVAIATPTTLAAVSSDAEHAAHREHVLAMLESRTESSPSGLLLVDPTEAEAVLSVVSVDTKLQADRRASEPPSATRAPAPTSQTAPTERDTSGSDRAAQHLDAPPYPEHELLAQRVAGGRPRNSA